MALSSGFNIGRAPLCTPTWTKPPSATKPTRSCWRTPTGERISVVQVAGLIARRILCYVRAGDRLERGERFGFIRFGSRVDVYLPRFARPMVAVGDAVHAGTSVLAEF